MKTERHAQKVMLTNLLNLPTTGPLQGSWGVTTFDLVGGRVIMGATNGTAHAWNLPEAPVPVPEWFLRFAEELAGIRLGELGSVDAGVHAIAHR